MISYHCTGNSVHIFQINQVQVQCWIFQTIREFKTQWKGEIFFTNQYSKRLFIDMRDSLGVTGKKRPIENE